MKTRLTNMQKVKVVTCSFLLLFCKQCRLISDSSKYQTLPGKLSRPEQNGERERRSSPLQLSLDESEESEINLSKCTSKRQPFRLQHTDLILIEPQCYMREVQELDWTLNTYTLCFAFNGIPVIFTFNIFGNLWKNLLFYFFSKSSSQ